MANPIVTFQMEDGDIIKVELYPSIAPNTVSNFISLVKKGFYDGLIFHRVFKADARTEQAWAVRDTPSAANFPEMASQMT